MDFLSSASKKKLVFKCAPCYFKPVLTYFSQPATKPQVPVLTDSLSNQVTIPTDNVPSSSTSNLNPDTSTSTSITTTSISESSTSSSSLSSNLHKPRHIRHSLRLQPTSTSLVLSDSQLKHLSKYDLDGSGLTQVYSLSGGTLSDLTNALNDLYDSSLSSRRDKITDVFVFIGGNDLSSGANLTSVDQDLNKLIGTLCLVLPKAEQHFLSFLPRPDTQPDLISAANLLLKRSCGPHFVELPLLSATSTFFKPDGVHLNFKGVSTVCKTISSILNVQGSRNTLQVSRPQRSTAALLPTPLLPFQKTIPHHPVSPSTPPSFATVVAKPVKQSPSSSPLLSRQFKTSPQSNTSFAHSTSKTSLLPTPTRHQFIPPSQTSSHFFNSPHSTSYLSNPLSTNASVHPPGIQACLLNRLIQTLQYQILSGIQTHLPLLLSQILSKN